MNITSIYSQRALTVMQGIFSNSSNQTDQSGLDQLNQTVIAKYYGTADYRYIQYIRAGTGA